MNKNTLKAARVMTGMTQEQLAKKLGKKQRWVSDVERGGIGNVKFVDVLRLCKVLGINIQDVTDLVSVG